MKQQREERVRSFNGFLTQDHMMSMKEIGQRFVKRKKERERERERERGVDTISLSFSPIGSF
jgi:hypothetical protein